MLRTNTRAMAAESRQQAHTTYHPARQLPSKTATMAFSAGIAIMEPIPEAQSTMDMASGLRAFEPVGHHRLYGNHATETEAQTANRAEQQIVVQLSARNGGHGERPHSKHQSPSVSVRRTPRRLTSMPTSGDDSPTKSKNAEKPKPSALRLNARSFAIMAFRTEPP